ncbi:anhydro-N-acetylmuramic acid kinase [Glaciibacter sp. 2TAF33]|uniref:anhydro-N-acetylmuramic acid kinase n=1 Tax=Glaciibacter sp. 2TAF33 TaxID=3233015 RepID=UPI003F8F9BDA
MRILSLQSGTSADGIDVAVADVEALDDSDRPPVRMRPLLARTVGWPQALRDRLIDAVHGHPVTAGEVCQLDTLAGQAFASAARDAIRELGTPVDLVVSHGQTLYHWVEDAQVRGTLQIGEPSWIAEATHTPVLSHLRSADIAAGGEGAPLMGLFDQAWLGDGPLQSGVSAATVNLGGIANVQILTPQGRLTAFDSGPGNCLIDAVVARASGGTSTYDADGTLAAAGEPHEGLLLQLLAHPYFSAAPPKSTGRETFTLDVVDAATDATGCDDIPLADLVATLTALTARSVAEAVGAASAAVPGLLLASGGGVRNPALMRALASDLRTHGIALESSAEHGIDPDFKESYLFALIGFLSWHGVPAALPATPAGAERILGRLTFGSARPGFPRALRGISGLRLEGAPQVDGAQVENAPATTGSGS